MNSKTQFFKLKKEKNQSNKLPRAMLPFQRTIRMQPNSIQCALVHNKLEFPIQLGLQNIINLHENVEADAKIFAVF